MKAADLESSPACISGSLWNMYMYKQPLVCLQSLVSTIGHVLGPDGIFLYAHAVRRTVSPWYLTLAPFLPDIFFVDRFSHGDSLQLVHALHSQQLASLVHAFIFAIMLTPQYMCTDCAFVALCTDFCGPYYALAQA